VAHGLSSRARIGAKGHHDRCTRDGPVDGKKERSKSDSAHGTSAIILDSVEQIDDTIDIVSRASTRYWKVDWMRMEENLSPRRRRTQTRGSGLFSTVDARSFVR